MNLLRRMIRDWRLHYEILLVENNMGGWTGNLYKLGIIFYFYLQVEVFTTIEASTTTFGRKEN